MLIFGHFCKNRPMCTALRYFWTNTAQYFGKIVNNELAGHQKLILGC